jgi:hypothetical protein
LLTRSRHNSTINFIAQAEQPIYEIKNFTVSDDPLSRRSIPFQCSETGSSECYFRIPPDNSAPLKLEVQPITKASMETEGEGACEQQQVFNRDMREPRLATCHASSLLNSENGDSLCTSPDAKKELKTRSGELFRQFVEDRIKDMSIYGQMEEEEKPLLAFGSPPADLSPSEDRKMDQEEKILVAAKEILADMVDEAVSDYQEIDFRNKICPEDAVLPLEIAEDRPVSGRDHPIGIRTNHIAIADFLTVLVDFIIENYAELVVQRYNAGVDVAPAESIKTLRQKEILLFSSEAELESYTGFLTSAESVEDLLQGLDARLLDDAIYCALRCEMMVDACDQGVDHRVSPSRRNTAFPVDLSQGRV